MRIGCRSVYETVFAADADKVVIAIQQRSAAEFCDAAKVKY
jgi:hypothetical protein